MKTPPPKPLYYAGLDVGPSQEFTALAVLERTGVPDPLSREQEVGSYALRHLERFPLGTSYPAVADRLQALFAQAPLTDAVLAVDRTAVGKPVVDLLRRVGLRAQIRATVVTSGHKAVLEEGVWQVPKLELVSLLQIVLQARRLQVAQGLAEAPVLLRELTTFRAKRPAAGDDALADWRTAPHDDLVLAAALAVWHGERHRSTAGFLPYVLGNAARRWW